MGFETGDFKEKKAWKWICILNVEEKKEFKLFLDFWSQKYFYILSA